jgi:hypothetical protein
VNHVHSALNRSKSASVRSVRRRVDGAGSVKVMMAMIEKENKIPIGHGAQPGVHTFMSIGGFQGRRGKEMDRSCGHNCAEKWRQGVESGGPGSDSLRFLPFGVFPLLLAVKGDHLEKVTATVHDSATSRYL